MDSLERVEQAERDIEVSELSLGDVRWGHALPILQELRPHLTAESFAVIHAEGARQGLKFTGVFADGLCVAVAGWRIITNTSAVRKLYVDDLSVSPYTRSAGYGKLLLDHLTERAVDMGCTLIDLDSGVQRFDAHRFYLRERFHIASHHFSKFLSEA